jgi:hypothetical protein
MNTDVGALGLADDPIAHEAGRILANDNSMRHRGWRCAVLVAVVLRSVGVPFQNGLRIQAGASRQLIARGRRREPSCW